MQLQRGLRRLPGLSGRRADSLRHALKYPPKKRSNPSRGPVSIQVEPHISDEFEWRSNRGKGSASVCSDQSNGSGDKPVSYEMEVDHAGGG